MIITEMRQQNLQAGMADKYGNFLLGERDRNNGLLGWKQPGTNSKNSLQWNNIENIDSGSAGLVLLLLELYRQTKDEAYLCAADESIEDILNYCENTPTDNYSFYTGRGGVVYLLIQRYLLDGDQEFIKKGLEVIRPANLAYLQSEFTTDYLYDGRAGTLLVLLHLYLVTQEPFLLKYIDQFIEKILDNAVVSEEGIYWHHKEGSLQEASPGFARGVMGIRYVINQLNQYALNSALDFVLTGIDQYLEATGKNKPDSWGHKRVDILNKETLEEYRSRYAGGDMTIFEPEIDYSWADGFISLPLAEMNTDHFIPGKMHTGSFPGIQNHSYHLFDGAAGHALIALFSKVPGAQEMAENIVAAAFKDSKGNYREITLDGGLMHGDAGILYLLIKLTGEEMRENILLPFYTAENDSFDFIWDVSLELADVKKKMLFTYYPKTFFLLSEALPDLLSRYTDESIKAGCINEVNFFSEFIKNSAGEICSPAVYDRVMDVFSLDEAKAIYRKRELKNPLLAYLDGLNYLDEMDVVMNKPDEWLKQKKLFVTAHIIVCETNWDWSISENLKLIDRKRIAVKYRKNLEDTPTRFQHFYHIFGNTGITEFPVSLVSSFLLTEFASGKTINDAIYSVSQKLKLMPESIAKSALLPELNHKKISSYDELIAELDWILLKYIKPFLYRSILLIRE